MHSLIIVSLLCMLFVILGICKGFPQVHKKGKGDLILNEDYDHKQTYFSNLGHHNITKAGLEHVADRKVKQYNFPSDFLIGCASAAYQVEGAWNEDGKGENVWDFFTHSRPELIIDKTNGDVACNSYQKYKEDVALIKTIGFDVYRFSISWSRIMPTGEDYEVNEAGVQYYQNLIDELLKNDIIPLVTLYHWDLPQRLSQLGGWVNPIIADYFEKFARVAFNRFGDKVKLWLTLSDPFSVVFGYGSTGYPPALNFHGVGEYLAGHNLLRAHAKAYHLYNSEFRKLQKGKVGITLSSEFFFPKSDSVADREAAKQALQFQLGWFAHPIFSNAGDYPEIMRKVIDENSEKEGRSSSRLPAFTSDEIKNLKGSSDFFGLNHFTSYLVSYGVGGQIPSWDNDVGVIKTVDSNWLGSTSEWLKVVPEGLRCILNWIKMEYNNPPVIVTANGFSDGGEIEDNDRINYHQEYLEDLLKAVHEDKCNVKGYMVWSIIDSFEWFKGYTEKFGLYSVDFSDKNRTRTEKKSVAYFREILKTRSVPEKPSTY